MNSKKCCEKRLMLRDSNEKGFDASRFTILCASHIPKSHQLKTGGEKIIKTTPVQKEKSARLCRYK